MRINTQYIKQLMIRDEVKQKDLADKLGMHPTALSYSLAKGKITKRITTHTGRHTFATAMIRGGMSISAIRDSLVMFKLRPRRSTQNWKGML